MSNEKIPYLCGGVLFTLLKQAALPSISSKEHYEGKSDEHKDSKMMKDFVSALSLDTNTKAIKSKNENSLKTLVSKYINCLTNAPKTLPFAQQPFVANYQGMVQNEYTKAVEKMQNFIQLHLDPQYYKWLVKAILYVVENDVDIPVTDQFFIDASGIPKTKEEIRSINFFGISDVLVGMMHYILLNRGKNNKDGACTLNNWCPQEQYIERTLCENADICIGREIEVFLTCPQPIAGQEAYEFEMTEEIPEIKKSYSIQDKKLFEQFKADAQDTMLHIIAHDPIYEPIELSFLCDLADLCKIWEYLVYKFRDREIRDYIIMILDLLNQYSYYISDEFLREVDEQKFIFRNQSIEEGDKLKDILQPQITELREKIAVEFGQIYNI